MTPPETPTEAAGPPSLRPLPVLGAKPRPRRFPSWIKVRYAENDRYTALREKMRKHDLHTVCEEAECPNIGECWSHGTATFMLLGDTCTRGCTFCAVGRGRPLEVDPREPEKVAEVVEDLGLDYVVLTSVNRDDLPDEGADVFARTVEAIAERVPGCEVEVLVPDFHAREELLERLLRTPLLVFAHNLETVPRLYRRVRTGSDYRRSLRVLELAKEIAPRLEHRRAREPAVVTKSSLMLGLGETRAELRGVFHDLRERGVDVLTLGQYLQPSPAQAEVFRFVPPEEFAELREEALALGFSNVVSGPMSRSSYHAWEVAEDAGVRGEPRAPDAR